MVQNVENSENKNLEEHDPLSVADSAHCMSEAVDSNAASLHSDRCTDDYITEKSRNGRVELSHEHSSFKSIVLSGSGDEITFGEALCYKVDIIKDKGAHGVKVCRALASFLLEKSEIEQSYGKALLKAAKSWNHSQSCWAPRLCSEGWNSWLPALSSIGKQHVGLGLCIKQNISKALETFALSQAQEVQRLGEEAQTVIREMEGLHMRFYKAKESYEKTCIEANHAIKLRNKAQEEAINQVETPRGVSKGASDIFTRMFEQTREGVTKIGKTKPQGISDLEDRAKQLVGQVEGKEKAYEDAVSAVNSLCGGFQAAMDAKLNTLQRNEENRIGFIKDVLTSLHTAVGGMLTNLTSDNSPLSVCTKLLKALPLNADEAAFEQFMASKVDISECGKAADSNSNLGSGVGDFSVEEKGKGILEGVKQWNLEISKVLQGVLGVLADVISAQEGYSRALKRLLEHEGYPCSEGSMTSNDLFGKGILMNQRTCCAELMESEGPSLRAGWDATVISTSKHALHESQRITQELEKKWHLLIHQMNEEAKAGSRKVGVTLSEATKRVNSVRAAQSKAIARLDRVSREIADKQEQLIKCRSEIELNPTDSAIQTNAIGQQNNGQILDVTGLMHGLESLGLAPGSADRARGLEGRIIALLQEKSLAQEAVAARGQEFDTTMNALTKLSETHLDAAKVEDSNSRQNFYQILKEMSNFTYNVVTRLTQSHESSQPLLSSINSIADIAHFAASEVAINNEINVKRGQNRVIFLRYEGELLQHERELLDLNEDNADRIGPVRSPHRDSTSQNLKNISNLLSEDKEDVEGNVSIFQAVPTPGKSDVIVECQEFSSKIQTDEDVQIDDESIANDKEENEGGGVDYPPEYSIPEIESDSMNVAEPAPSSLQTVSEGKERLIQWEDTLSKDHIIESFSCALVLGKIPKHGRLSILAESIRFSAWPATRFDLPLSDIAAIEKTTFLMFVSNALTLTTKSGEKFVLGSFLYRDECFSLLTKLMCINTRLTEIHENEEGIPPESRTYAPPVLPRDSISDPDRYEIILDTEIDCNPVQALKWLWGPESNFWGDFCKFQGEQNLVIGPWAPVKNGNFKGFDGGCFAGEAFDWHRTLEFDHPRTKMLMVGPKMVHTEQQQALRFEGEDRCIVCLTTSINGVAFSDCFIVAQRIVLTAIHHQHVNSLARSRLQVGVEVVMLKFALVKGQIRSASLEEVRDTWQAYFPIAKGAILCMRTHLGDQFVDSGSSGTNPPSDLFKKSREIQPLAPYEERLLPSPVLSAGTVGYQTGSEGGIRRGVGIPCLNFLAHIPRVLFDIFSLPDFLPYLAVFVVVCFLYSQNMMIRDVRDSCARTEKLVQDLMSKMAEEKWQRDWEKHVFRNQ